MSETTTKETPTQVLARQIVERLVENKLIRKTNMTHLQQKLVEGKASAEDWRLAVELASEQE